MKTNSFKSLIVGAILILTASCSNDTLPVYEDVNRVYFAYANTRDIEGIYEERENIDNRIVSLGYDNPVKADSTVFVRVRLQGRLSDTDRLITAEVIRMESTAIPVEDIEILPSFMPAGENIGYLGVKIKNSEKMTKSTLRARIRLTPNEFFHTDVNAIYSSLYGTRASLEYSIYFDAIADMPNLWKDAPQMTNYFGAWSKVKEEMLCEVFGVTREFFMYDPETEIAATVLSARITNQVSYGLISLANRYLRDYKEANNGEPLRDENGNEVKMGLTLI